MSHGEEFFNEQAAKWDEHPEIVETAHKVCDTIMHHMKGKDMSKMSVLEIGAGTGNVAVQLAKQVGYYVAIDTSDKMLEKLKTKAEGEGLENVTTLNQAVETADDLPGQTFDICVIVMTLHHVENAQNMVSLLGNVLNPKGHLFIFDLEKTEESAHMHDHVNHEEASVHHAGGFTSKELCEMMAEAGLIAHQAKSEFKMKMIMHGDEHHGHGHGHHDKQDGHVEHHGNHKHHHKPEKDDEQVVHEFPILCAIGEKAG